MPRASLLRVSGPPGIDMTVSESTTPPDTRRTHSLLFASFLRRACPDEQYGHQASLNPGDVARILFVLRRKPARIIKEIGIGLMLLVSAIEVSTRGTDEDKAMAEATKVLQIARAQHKAAARNRNKLRSLPSLHDKLSGWAARKASRVPQTVELLASHKITEDDSQLLRANLPSLDEAQAAQKVCKACPDKKSDEVESTAGVRRRFDELHQSSARRRTMRLRGVLSDENHMSTGFPSQGIDLVPNSVSS